MIVVITNNYILYTRSKVGGKIMKTWEMVKELTENPDYSKVYKTKDFYEEGDNG